MSYNSPVFVLRKITEKSGLSLPFYYVECVEERPKLIFKCVVKACSVKATGYGTSKRKAREEAAKRALEMLIPPSTSNQVETFNYARELCDFAEKCNLHWPIYRAVPFHGSSVVFLTICQLDEYCTEGYGASSTESEHDAARNMLHVLNLVCQIPEPRPATKKRKRKGKYKKPVKKISVQHRLDRIKNSASVEVVNSVAKMDWSPL